MPQDHPKITPRPPQDAPKTAQDRPKTAKIGSSGPKNDPRPAKMNMFIQKKGFANSIEKCKENQRFLAPQPPKNRPKKPNIAQRCLKDLPKTAQDRSKTTSRRPKTAQDRSKTAPRTTKKGQDHPKSDPRRPKTAPRPP